MSFVIANLRDKHRGETAYILGSGPSLPDVSNFQDRITIALNHTRSLIKPTYWLYGDRKFARWDANKVAKRVSPDVGTIICNENDQQWIDKKFRADWDFQVYHFVNKVDKKDRSGHWLDWRLDSFLPGRWTIVTIGLSLSCLMGASRVVLLGIDMSIQGGKVYSEQLSNVSHPKKQSDYIGQWKKWLSMGFKKGLWPIEVLTTSPYLLDSCPGLPIKRISLGEALSC